jgi:aldose 1-epimerase
MNRKIFGKMPDGEIVEVLVLKNKNGMQVDITNFGATLTSIKLPVSNNAVVDVVLGFDSLNDYLASFLLPNPPFLGATIGRYAGRINQGAFVLNDEKFQLNKNHHAHCLHGGIMNFSRVVWEIEAMDLEQDAFVRFKYISKDGEENFPGELTISLQFTLTEKNEIILDYQAVSTKDTIINLTNHSYFNLDGHTENVTNQQLLIPSETLVKTNEEKIPTGDFISVKNTHFNFTTPKNCPEKIDTSFVLSGDKNPAAILVSKKNQLKMSVFTNQPSVHVYVGGECQNIKGKENTNYHALSGICFETQNFPDAPNHPHFPSAVLKVGNTYRQTTIFQFESL